MMLFIILAVIVGAANARNNGTICECSVFARAEQPGNPAYYQVSYLGLEEFPDEDCMRPIVESDCYNYCFDLGQTFIDASGICVPHIAESKQECYGNIWCERIATESPGNNAEGTWELAGFFRNRCNDTDWIEIGDVESKETLCCSDQNEMEPCVEGVDCNCDFDDDNRDDCECGVFVPAMFENKHRPNPHLDPLPLDWMGTPFNHSAGDWPAACLLFPAHPDDDIYPDFCTNACWENAEDMFEISLGDPHENNPTLTYGDVFCTGLYSRIANYEPFENAPLVVYGRVKDCGTVGKSYANHVELGLFDEALCCDSVGSWYECPLQ